MVIHGASHVVGHWVGLSHRVGHGVQHEVELEAGHGDGDGFSHGDGRSVSSCQVSSIARSSEILNDPPLH